MTETVEELHMGGMLLLGIPLHACAVAAARRAERWANAMGAAAVATLLTVLVWGLCSVGLWNARDVLAAGVLAWFSACCASLAAVIVVPPAAWLVRGWRDAVRAHKQEIKRWREREVVRKTRAALPPPPPPPQAVPIEEQLEAARARARHRIELIEATAELEPEDRRAQINEELDALDRKLREIRAAVR